MGDRASYAIVEDGRLEVFYGNWGAATLLADIFWSPAICEAQIRRQEASATWLDDVFGEAAVALCKDTRVVTFYDSRFSEPTRLTAARMMAALWPGWTVRSVSYVSAVAASVGVDLVSTAAPNFLSTLNPELALARVGSLAAGELPRDGVVHWIRGTTRSVHVSNEPLTALLLCGPRLIQALPRLPSLDEAMQSASTRSASGALLAPPALCALLAVTIDETTQTLRVTIAPSIKAAGDRAALRGLEALWPEWKIRVEIGPFERHFSELGDTLPGHLVPTEAPLPLGEQLRAIATSLLADDAFKSWARGWLERVETIVGVPPGGFAARAPVPVELETAERLRLFELAARAIHVEDADVQVAIRDVEVAADDRAFVPDREVVARSVTRIVGQGTFAVRQPMDAGTPFGLPSLLTWTEPVDTPRLVCELPRGPVRTPGVTGMPGTARLLPAPSGRALLAILETAPCSLVWIDLVRNQVQEIAVASRLAQLDVDSDVEWSSNRDRFSILVVDTCASRCGEGRVVVYDADQGWLAEGTGPLFVGGLEEVRRPACGGSLEEVRRPACGGSIEEVRRPACGGSIEEVRRPACGGSLEEAIGPADGLVEARMTGQVRGRELSPEIERRIAIVTADRETALARAALGAEDHAAAEAHARAAFVADPASPAAFEMLCEVLQSHQAWADLVHACERHLALVPSNREAWLGLCNAERMRGDLPRAVQASARCVDVAPHWVNAHWFAAGMLALSGRLDEAAAAASQAVECDRQSTEKIALDDDLKALWGNPAFRSLDYVRLLATARNEEALAGRRSLYARAIELLPDRREAHEALLALERGAEDLDRALAVVERWCSWDPSSVVGAQARCELLVDLGRLDDAAHAAADLLAHHDDAPLVHLQLARIALRRGDEPACLAHMRLGEKAFERSEHHPWASYVDDEVQRFEELAPLVERVEEWQ